jgi:hypothetical protein
VLTVFADFDPERIKHVAHAAQQRLLLRTSAKQISIFLLIIVHKIRICTEPIISRGAHHVEASHLGLSIQEYCQPAVTVVKFPPVLTSAHQFAENLSD